MSPSPVSSTPILRTTLLWSAGATAVLALAGALIGYVAAGPEGLWSALAGVVLAAVFLAITGLSILIANRWYGDDLYVPVFFGIVMGAWILKFIVFIAVLVILRGQPWINPVVFFIAIVAGIVVSLLIDVVVMLRMRIPHVSDTTLPTVAPDDDAPRQGPADSGGPKV
ncbi:hypothetical protein [Microbacterium sp. SLBN-146]|uniref:hypothetical protein n=1 Tax=Microbacterium sp. SLBN-146 TaxID=2768457 RepID=UPI001150A3D6|nr:hypothetical protein [Microbacterium sp. SLBN-146]TQJ32578.1 hypothetical protein FBY39_3089 [Microbacterium sp. SLBN-146]